ncbi:maleylpyruvate isomerase family mycothiol-dependent enzyme [Nocardioides sp. SYSU DS0651]|uniref:maleylpyruvate isomerase family mycothiol-dependent enzyme n=1 Tax=Nocardioides sp. SYSU DS0651 TaxID=3415955 RepID=UPI003F4BACE1
MDDTLRRADQRLLDDVGAMAERLWGGESLCRGWSRAHVVAHLALNAEALAGVVRGAAEGRAVPMYAAGDARDADIAALSGEPPALVRERLLAATDAFDDALTVLGSVPDGATFERTPGGRVLPVSVVPALRLREVEIHHADLAVGYSYADWPVTTAAAFLDADAGRHEGEAFTALATDADLRWLFGDPGPAAPVVRGPVAALAWWATGRELGPVVSSTTGRLPTMEGR